MTKHAVWRRRSALMGGVGLATAWALLMSGAALAAETGPDNAARVLPAGVEHAVEAAFQRAAPTWRLKSAKVDKVSVAATVCAPPDVCHDLVLSDPKAVCRGKQVGPWCLTWVGAAPADPSKLVVALAADGDALIWHTIAARPKQPEIMEPIAGADGSTATAAGEHPAKGDGSGSSASRTSPGGGAADEQGEKPASDSTALLIIALVAAAGATFVLFRKSAGDENVDEDADEDDAAT